MADDLIEKALQAVEQARSTGKTINFCSSKCEKNMLKLKRLPRKAKWTVAARTWKEKMGGKK